MIEIIMRKQKIKTIYAQGQKNKFYAPVLVIINSSCLVFFLNHFCEVNIKFFIFTTHDIQLK